MDAEEDWKGAAVVRMPLLAAAVLVAAACGGGGAADAPAEDTAGGGGAQTGGEAGGALGETTAAASEDQPETLDEYLGYDFDDPGAAAARDEEYRRRAEEMVARCMAAEGFEYVPAIRPVSSSNYEAYDVEEYVREEGFGITTWYGRESVFAAESDSWVNPNTAIVDSLSDSEKAVYYTVLNGAPTERSDAGGLGTAVGVAAEVEAGSEGEPVVNDAYGGGCTGAAYREIYGKQNEVLEQILPDLEEMWQGFEADPRHLQAEEDWRACMADRGHRYDNIDQMYEEIYEDFDARLDAIVGADGGWVDPFEGWTEEEIETFYIEKTDEEIEDIFEQAQSEARANVDQEALAALQQEERDLAVLNHQCSQSIRDTIEELRQEYEGRFVRENRELLEQIRE